MQSEKAYIFEFLKTKLLADYSAKNFSDRRPNTKNNQLWPIISASGTPEISFWAESEKIQRAFVHFLK